METRNINANYTEIYVTGGGNWLTQSFPTNFHTFFKKKILTKNESIEDWKEVTDAEKTALEKSDAEWVEPEKALIDRWNIACIDYPSENKQVILGQYNYKTGYFEYCGINDLSAKDAITTLDAGRVWGSDSQAIYCTNKNLRINLIAPVMQRPASQYPFYYCSNLEVANARGIKVQLGISGVPKLHTINELDNMVGVNAAINAANLVNLSIRALSNSFRIPLSSLISHDSLKQIVSNAVNTTPITITVHPDVYGKLMDEANEEWHQLLIDAAEKQIQFATA